MIQAYEIAHLIKINDLEKAKNIFKKLLRILIKMNLNGKAYSKL